jgi:hypothetical protein
MMHKYLSPLYKTRYDNMVTEMNCKFSLEKTSKDLVDRQLMKCVGGS